MNQRFTITGVIRCADGIRGAVDQLGQPVLDPASGGSAGIAWLFLLRMTCGLESCTGTLRIPYGDFDNLPGGNDEQKTEAVVQALSSREPNVELKDGFELDLEVLNGVAVIHVRAGGDATD